MTLPSGPFRLARGTSSSRQTGRRSSNLSELSKNLSEPSDLLESSNLTELSNLAELSALP